MNTATSLFVIDKFWIMGEGTNEQRTNFKIGEEEQETPIEVTDTSLLHPIIKRLFETLGFKPGFIDVKTKEIKQPMPIKTLLSEYGKIFSETKISEHLLEKRCIVGDVVFNSKDWTIKFNCKYWLSINVNNINSFIDFCLTHAFFPVVDRIIIDGYDITDNETLNDYFRCLIMEIDNPILKSTLINEAQKIEKNLGMLLEKVKGALEALTMYTTLTTQFILWENFEKIKNIWPLSENLFIEVAIRLENQIRDVLSFESSYMQVAWNSDDAQRKTDMYFFYKRTINGISKKVPIQFTYWKKSKEHNVEKYLVDHKDEHRERCFMIISVQWQFKEFIHKENLLWKYNNWLDNPEEREIVTDKRFPLFIDSVEQKIIQPAEIIYIALHILCREEFKMTFLERKWFVWDKRDEKFLHNEEHIINWINLDHISIEYVKDVEKPEKNKDPNKIELWSINKRKYVIKYNKTKIWTIIMYEW